MSDFCADLAQFPLDSLLALVRRAKVTGTVIISFDGGSEKYEVVEGEFPPGVNFSEVASGTFTFTKREVSHGRAR